MENERLEIRLSKSIKKQMKQKADKIGLTPSLIIRLLINDWLANDRVISIANSQRWGRIESGLKSLWVDRDEAGADALINIWEAEMTDLASPPRNTLWQRQQQMKRNRNVAWIVAIAIALIILSKLGVIWSASATAGSEHFRPRAGLKGCCWAWRFGRQ
jgi:hypothetical protein